MIIIRIEPLHNLTAEEVIKSSAIIRYNTNTITKTDWIPNSVWAVKNVSYHLVDSYEGGRYVAESLNNHVVAPAQYYLHD